MWYKTKQNKTQISSLMTTGLGLNLDINLLLKFYKGIKFCIIEAVAVLSDHWASTCWPQSTLHQGLSSTCILPLCIYLFPFWLNQTQLIQKWADKQLTKLDTFTSETSMLHYRGYIHLYLQSIIMGYHKLQRFNIPPWNINDAWCVKIFSLTLCSAIPCHWSGLSLRWQQVKPAITVSSDVPLHRPQSSSGWCFLWKFSETHGYP